LDKKGIQIDTMRIWNSTKFRNF